jgi:hypothetical protein
MRTSNARGDQFQNAPRRGRASDCGLFWSFPTVERLLLGVDAVAVALGAKGEKILDSVSMRATLTERIADPPPAFCVLAITSTTGPWHKPGVWHAGPVTSNKGKGLALTLIVDTKSVETITTALNRKMCFGLETPRSAFRVGAAGGETSVY